MHCELHIATATNVVTLVDISTNGVWVNGARVAKGVAVELASGDTVRLLNPAIALPEGPLRWNSSFNKSRPNDGKITRGRTHVLRVSRGVLPACDGHPVSSLLLRALFDTVARGPAPHSDCPECRSVVKEVRPSHKLNSLVDELLKSCQRSEKRLTRGQSATNSTPFLRWVKCSGSASGRVERRGRR